jgi:hypothetical protein
MEILEFVFSSFWTFTGTCVILYLLGIIGSIPFELVNNYFKIVAGKINNRTIELKQKESHENNN